MLVRSFKIDYLKKRTINDKKITKAFDILKEVS